MSWVGDSVLKNHPLSYIDHLFVRHDYGFKKIASNIIKYIKASSSYCEVYLTDGSTMVVSVPLSEVVSQLSGDSFIGNTLVMNSGVKPPIGRDYRKAALRRFTLVGVKSIFESSNIRSIYT